jgi:hypothetical protein
MGSLAAPVASSHYVIDTAQEESAICTGLFFPGVFFGKLVEFLAVIKIDAFHQGQFLAGVFAQVLFRKKLPS